MTDEYIPRHLSTDLDDQISQAKIEYMRLRIKEKKLYASAMKFHKRMFHKKIAQSETNFDKWDRAMKIIHAYRKKYYFTWMEQTDNEQAWIHDKEGKRTLETW